MSLIGKIAPEFKAKTVFEQNIKDISLSDYKRKYVVLFFYPLDFTFVCPTELHAFQEKLAEFEKRNTTLLACSVDSHFSHLAWLNTPKNEGGIKGISYGLISDIGGNIAQKYEVLNEENIAYRGLFIIDKEGIVRSQTINDLQIGRSVDEVLRTLDALQHFEKNGEVCPANWKKGDQAIKESKESVSNYLAKN